MVHAPGPQSMVITQNVPMQQQVKVKLISYRIDMKAKVTMIILYYFFFFFTKDLYDNSCWNMHLFCILSMGPCCMTKRISRQAHAAYPHEFHTKKVKVTWLSCESINDHGPQRQIPTTGTCCLPTAILHNATPSATVPTLRPPSTGRMMIFRKGNC